MSTDDPRKFPAPPGLSAQAQVVLNNAVPTNLEQPTLDMDDREGWRSHIAKHNAALASAFLHAVPGGNANVHWDRIAGVPVVRARPDERIFATGKVVFDIHGGAFIYMGGELVKAMVANATQRIGCDIVSLDYRMPPDHSYPAALDDCMAVYAELLKEIGPNNLIVLGTSAGGNLAAALMLRARDEGLAMPAALVLLSPEIDLTESGDTFQTLLGIDRMGLLTTINKLYANGQPLTHPYLSPLFGDVSGFPPTFLQSGTRDLFLSNTVRMHRALRAAGVAADLHIWDAMPHGGFFGAPEDAEVHAEVRQFLARHWHQ